MNTQFTPPTTTLHIDTPVMTREKFADKVGVSKRVVDNWIARGYIPAIKFNSGDSTAKYSLVNLSVLHRQCLEEL